MSVVVAVPDSQEGLAALDAAIAEARNLRTDLVVVDLALAAHTLPDLPRDLDTTVVDREGSSDRDPVEAVLDEIAERSAERLVIGVRHRSPIGKALLGSVSQRLLLESPVPVLTVKAS